jgi:hypothetical protein
MKKPARGGHKKSHPKVAIRCKRPAPGGLGFVIRRRPGESASRATHRDRLLIGEKNIDVYDPAYIEVNGQRRIAVSYDQNNVLELVGPAPSVN